MSAQSTSVLGGPTYVSGRQITISPWSNKKLDSSPSSLSSPPKQQYCLEDDLEVCWILDKQFPTLFRVSTEAAKGTKDLEEYLRKLEHDSANHITDIESLANLIQHGFIPKDIFRKLYEKNGEKYPSTFFMKLNQLKYSRQLFVAVDQDEMNSILTPLPTRCWYFVPALASLPLQNFHLPWSDISEEFSIVFHINLKSKKLIYWVATLLFEFCTPASIEIYADECHGTVGKLKVRILANHQSKLCKIYLYGQDESSKNHAFILLEAVKATVCEHSVLSLYLSFARIEKKDFWGNVYEQNETPLKRHCDRVIQKIQKEIINEAEANGKRMGNTQNLMSPIIDN